MTRLTKEREQAIRQDVELEYPGTKFTRCFKELLCEIDALRDAGITLGVGNGSGQLFVHGNHESIKACQNIILERDQLKAELRLQTDTNIVVEFKKTIEERDLARAHLGDAHLEIGNLKELLYHSEQWRQAYRKGKLDLYAMGGEVADAAMKHLPCSEGPLERNAVKALGHRTGWIELKEYDQLRERLDLESRKTPTRQDNKSKEESKKSE